MSFIPPEWAPHKAVWITWPSMSTWWTDGREDVLKSFAEMGATISRYVTLRVNCAPAGIADCKKRLAEANADMANVEIFAHESDDVWCRDSGAIFKIGDGGLEAVDFKYNAWGGKFPPWNRDDALASLMAKAAGAKRIRVENFICEGGALEFSDDEVLMTTDCVILNPNRNNVSAADAEQILKDALGVKKIIRLEDGLVGDDTDGHIDNIARFTPNGAILAAMCGKENPSFTQLEKNFAQLKNETDLGGKSYEVLPLNLPEEPVVHNGRTLPTSYANYLVTNGLVLVPTFGQKKSEDKALGVISEFFPTREVKGIDARVFLREGGTVHCLTQQEPAI